MHRFGTAASDLTRAAALTFLTLAYGCGGDEFTVDEDVAAAGVTSGMAGAATAGGGAGASHAGRNGAGVGATVGAGGAGSSAGEGGTPGAGGEGSPEAGAPSVSGGSGGSAGSASTAGAGGAVNECPCAAPKPACVSGKCVARGPALVKAGSIYVDSTEVTAGQYSAFLVSQGSNVSGQAPECSWNDSFAPAGAPQPATHPVTNVDFCDAAAFCAWAGKRLCGKLGGGKLELHEVPVTSKSEWFSACGGPKGQPFPYGAQHVDGACNDATGSGSIAPVGSFPGCTGVYAGVYDMVGNVSEWVDACDAKKDGWDGCETIGGSFGDTLPCSGSGLRHRDQREPSLGFRCCAN